MPRNRRLPPKLVTPSYEDSGIFKNKVSQFSVELVPQFAQNMRGDLVIKGILTVRQRLMWFFRDGARRWLNHFVSNSNRCGPVRQ